MMMAKEMKWGMFKGFLGVFLMFFGGPEDPGRLNIQVFSCFWGQKIPENSKNVFSSFLGPGRSRKIPEYANMQNKIIVEVF